MYVGQSFVEKIKNSSNLLILSSINIIAIMPNILFIGYKIYSSSGLIGAITVFLICSYLLYVASFSLTKVSITSKAEYIEIIAKYFGQKAAVLCVLAIAITLFGWFLWHLSFCVTFLIESASLQIPFLKNVSDNILGPSLGLLFCITALLKDYGLRLIGAVLVPLLLISICSLFLFLPYDLANVNINLKFQSITFSDLSILLGWLATLILTTPAFFRSVDSVKIAKQSLRTAYCIVLPFFYILGVLFGIFSKNRDIFTLSSYLIGWGPFFLTFYVILSGWSLCSLNLYYGADAFAQTTSSKNQMPFILFLGILGSIFFGQNRKFSFESSTIFGCLVVGILVIILVKIQSKHFKLGNENAPQQRGNYYSLLISYVVGVLVLCDVLVITGSLFFDMALAAFVSCVFFTRYPPKKLNLDFLKTLKKRFTQNKKPIDD